MTAGEFDPTDLIAERQATHGDFAATALVAQTLKLVMRDLSARLPPVQREALDQIAAKIARILCGDAVHPDHWHDIAGYAELAARACR